MINQAHSNSVIIINEYGLDKSETMHVSGFNCV
ncbi:hypothetical protein CGSSa00_12467 [Staphylococcus aureus subsp. aureus CGS00]|nr:hypothetical protein USA300HOU_0486 [Staphylococcus aureus subsp. aureus USA300_TCH1516]EFG43764.1 conserved hypothetical protein [Staphylococcus aureus A8819]EFH35904.1 conserved hypothetical protein [Staphylococcus aureus A8796]EFT84615.1 hypothetical protein CGSSa03_01525 [Staphylococcus aureus subsp. aureus CGS03]EFU24241.1 hypothetical protein CGSSa00_12467 [Staphylococcus aureus subsp. aureus CGS00]EFU26523.1 hypothetical protein CGSSa01_12423 [Staphylococcus aureus subsp. aureus CGS0